MSCGYIKRSNLPKIHPEREYLIVDEQPYGKQAQVDFGEYNMRDGNGHRVKVWFFTMVLSRSRHKYVSARANAYRLGIQKRLAFVKKLI